VTLRRSEIFVDVCAILATFHAIGWMVQYVALNPSRFALIVDINIYREAALGRFNEAWMYADWTAFHFIPLTWFQPLTAYLLASGLNMIFYILLIHKLSEVKYGVALAFLFLPIYHLIVHGGNIEIFQAFVSCYPLGAVWSILCKPYIVVLALICPPGRAAIKALASRIQQGISLQN